jgi:predicted nucleotidyltransferase
VTELNEIISFRGRFSDQARKGERITARGQLERIESGSEGSYQRLVVGGAAGDFLVTDPSGETSPNQGD